MSNYLRRVTETVQDIAPQSDVTVVQQQSTTDPGKVVIGFQLSQATWDRAIGAASVFAVFGGAVYIQRWYKRWQKERRLQHKRNEIARARLEMHRHSVDTFHAARYSPESEPQVTHYGGCHCKRVKFMIEAPATIRAVDCSTSMGGKKGRFPYVYVTMDDFKLISGKEFLSVYTFGTHTAKHMFCSVCGVHTMGVPRGTPEEGGISVNVHCIEPETVEQVHVSYIPGEHFVSDVEPAITTRASLSKGVLGSKHADVETVFSSETEMASRWLTGTEEQIKQLARTPEIIRMNHSGKNHGKTKSTQRKMSGKNKYMRSQSSPQSSSSSLIHTLVHGTAQATTAAAAAAASTLNDVAEYTSTINQQQQQPQNHFNNNYSNNNMYLINDENNNENMMNMIQPSRTSRSFSTGSNVDDIKNQLQRYLKKYPGKNSLTSSFNTKTPLKRSTRY
jgi:hypothetical protein